MASTKRSLTMDPGEPMVADELRDFLASVPDNTKLVFPASRRIRYVEYDSVSGEVVIG